MNNRGITYLEIIVGITISALIFWLSINLLSFVIFRDVQGAYNQEFETAKAQVHELLTHEIAWSNDFQLDGNDSLTVDGVEYSVRSGNLTKNGKQIELENVIVDSLDVKNLSTNEKLATVQVQITLRHQKINQFLTQLTLSSAKEISRFYENE